MTRHEALEHILTPLSNRDLALFTTGMISREAFNIRDRAGEFLYDWLYGAAECAWTRSGLAVTSLENLGHRGDGSALMSLGRYR
jgi:hypothetical protein